MTENCLQLSNGLTISYARFGVPDGKPAFYFHGLPGSMYEGQLLHQACMDYGIDLIAPDRFGYGNSSPCVDNRYLAWTDCIREMADQLSFDRFYLLAASGGAPYALACASRLTDRIIATGICCGLGSLAVKALRQDMSLFARLAVYLARKNPLLLTISYGITTHFLARLFSRQILTVLAWFLGGRDKPVLFQTSVKRILAKNIYWAFNQGSRGAIADLVAAGHSWPFALDAIENLQLWHGDCDRVVPISHSQWVLGQIPAAQMHIISGEGHFSLAIGHIDQVVQNILKS